MGLEQIEQEGQHIDAVPLNLDEPGLVVQAGGNHMHIAAVQFGILREHPLLLGPHFHTFGDLPVSALHAVAQADGLDAAILVAGPGVHRHRVGVVEEQRAWFGHLADIFTEIQQGQDGALPVHDAAGAQRIAHALVYPVFEWDIDIRLEGFQPPWRIMQIT